MLTLEWIEATPLSDRARLEAKGFDLKPRMEAAMDHFPVLRRKAHQQASTLSGGEQKMLEIARGEAG